MSVPLARRVPLDPRARARLEARHARGGLGVRGHRDRVPRGESARARRCCSRTCAARAFRSRSTCSRRARRIEWALGRTPRAVGAETRIDLPRAAAAGASATCGRCAAARGACSRSRPQRVGAAPAQAAHARRGPRRAADPQAVAAGRRALRHVSARAHRASRRRASAISASTACTSTTRRRPACTGRSARAAASTTTRPRSAARPLEVAVAVGADPATLLVGGRAAARGHRRARVRGLPARRADAARARAHAIDLRVPADAEFVIEGVVPPASGAMEGPFGDHFGHYSHAAPFPVFHVRAVTHRARAGVPGERGGQAAAGRQVHGRGGAGDVHRRAQA